MTKEQLFEKYKIDSSHSKWEPIDSFMSVEIFRIMHNRLPSDDEEESGMFILDFLDKAFTGWWAKNIMIRPDWGSLFLSAKRCVYMFADNLVLQLNKKK
jgi:hypothetical protein